MKIKTKLFDLLISFILLFSVNAKAESKACEYKDKTVNVVITLKNNNIIKYQFFEYDYENKENYVVQELANKSIINDNDFSSGCPNQIYYTKTDTCSRKKMENCTNYNRYYAFYSSSNNENELVSLPFVKTIDNPQNNTTSNVNTNFFGSLSVVKCGNAEIPSSLPSIIRTIINLIKIAVPIALIIMGMIDMLKAVIASDDKKISTSQNQFFKRLLLGGGTYLVVTIVQLIIGIIASDDASIINCVSCMVNDESTCLAINKPVLNPGTDTDNNNNNNENNDNIDNNDNNNEFVTSSPDITFSYKYVRDDNYMPYGLFTPSTASKNQDIPLIIWLHGGGDIFTTSQEGFKQIGLMGVLNNWQLDGFNAYVLCPHLTGKWYTGLWVTEKTKDNLYSLIDKFIEENNINTNKIILVGFSQGARGALYIPTFRPDFFSSLVVLSAFDQPNDISSLKHIPARGYSEGFEYMRTTFVDTFGKENYIEIISSHDNLPNATFNRDENNDNKSDVIEWMLTQ